MSSLRFRLGAWGADASESRRIFDLYLERGANFIDTANGYTNGSD
jgi:aryl-alcohol dehydrogenase-like predicted oxidoreductase